MNIGVLGLGKLGMPLAAVYAAAAGHSVCGWDVDPSIREDVRHGTIEHAEPEVTDMLTDCPIRLTEPDRMAQQCDAVFVVVPTLSLSTGAYDAEHVIDSIVSLGRKRDREESLPVIIVSTVSPGTCDALLSVIPPWMRLVYAPTLIALGSVVNDLTMPDVQIVGVASNDVEAEARAHHVLHSAAPYALHCEMSYESAEIAKVALNAYVTMKITFANVIGQVCDQYEHADVDDVLEAIGYDHRIGQDALTAGAPYGGPCFPRDNRAFKQAAGAVDTLAGLVDHLNDAHLEYLFHRALMPAPFKFAVLGHSYKDGVDIRIASFGDRLAEMLASHGGTPAPTENADVVIIAMPLRDESLAEKVNNDARVIDVWRTHVYLEGIVKEYVGLGRTT